MAKISAYKVVKPGAFSHVSPQVASVRKSTYAINRLGATISSMGSVVKDLESIEAARVTNNKLAEQAERRRLQREADEAAETQAEINKLGKKGGLKSNIKVTGKNKGLLKSLLPGWLNMLMPVFEFFAKLIAFPVVREMLKWWGDPANVEKVETFLYKANVIWTKLYNFGKWLVNDKLIEGFSTGPFMDRTANYITLPKSPLVAVTSFKYYDDSDTESTFATSNYYVDNYSDTPKIVLRRSQTFPDVASLRVANAFIITFTAGYGTAPKDVPETIKQAINLYTSHLYENRELYIEQKPIPVPMTLGTLLQPFKVIRFSNRLWSGNVRI